MSTNGTYRELESRVLAYRERTGQDYSKLWISQDRWKLLPQAFREAVMVRAFHKRTDAAGTVLGVPLGIITVLDPEVAPRIWPGWAAHGRQAFSGGLG